MSSKLTYEELELRVKELEKAANDRVGSEKQLKLLSLAIDQSSEGIAVIDLDGNLEYLNNAFAKMHGYSAEELAGKNLSTFHTPEQMPSVETANLELKQTGNFKGEIWHVKRDGTVFPTVMHNSLIRDDTSKPIGMMGTLRDITDIKQAEEALQKKTHDLGERVKELNSLYGIANIVEQQDISLEEILQGIVDLISPSWKYPEITCARIIIQDREWRTKNFRETIWKQASDIKVHGERSGNLEVYYLEEKPEINEGPFLREERNLINAIAGLTGRIVERKQGEEALRESEEKYRTLLETTSEGCWMLNPELKTIEVNAALCKMLGYSQDEMIGKTPLEFVDDVNRKIFIEQTSKISVTAHRSYEITLKKKNGQDLPTYFNATTIRGESGEVLGAFAFITDITERKRAEEYIHTLTQELLKAQESERQMISRELHDRVAQDLSTVKISFETLFDNQHTTPPEFRRRVSEISRTLQESINAVRDLSYDLRPPTLDAMGLVQALFQYCNDFSEDNGINVDFCSAGMENLNLDFDTEINLYRLIQEGLTNIKKHADADHVTIRLVAAFPNIILRIEDDGKGFNVQKRMATITKEKRMGIRSMEQRAKLLQGEMEIQSKPMQGTKISITLPYKDMVSNLE